ncbi:MAG: DUF1295 domain-containing protein [Caldithrix sp.]|nr:DUF1295 domain-containing protein [Caldithrix sp.]
MALHEEYVKRGNWFFRYRSYLPIIFLILLLIEMRNFEYLGGQEIYHRIWLLFSVFISLAGLVVRGLAIGYSPRKTSGRNTKKQVAESLNNTGIYSVVRHPLYLGNFLIWLGVAFYPHQWWFIVLAILLFWIYYEQIMFAEEAFLRQKFGQDYEQWAKQTPAFIPSLKKWSRPDRQFSFRKVVKREYIGFFTIILVFTLLEVTAGFVVYHKFHVALFWQIVFIVSFIFYLTIRFINKKTKLLYVPEA